MSEKKKYQVTYDVWGYSRGYEIYEIEAESEEEAKELAQYNGKLADEGIIRDDRESEFNSIEEIK